MIDFTELLINRAYERLFLQSIFISKDGSMAIVHVPEDINIFKNEALKLYLLRIKSDLEAMNIPKAITFILVTENKIYAYGVDTSQKYICVLDNPAQYVTNMLIYKDENWIIRMMRATRTEKFYGICEINTDREIINVRKI